VVPWLRRFGLINLLQTHLRTAADDLSLSDQDLQRSTTPAAGKDRMTRM
jgi:hypothetical protein